MMVMIEAARYRLLKPQASHLEQLQTRSLCGSSSLPNPSSRWRKVLIADNWKRIRVEASESAVSYSPTKVLKSFLLLRAYLILSPFSYY